MTKKIHRCKERDALFSSDAVENRYYGPAVTSIFMEDERLYAENGEYVTSIGYCPYCGKSVKEIEASDDD